MQKQCNPPFLVLKHLMVLLAICFGSLAYGQNGQQAAIQGKVTDKEQQPLAGVTVSIKGSRIAATTNSEGRYTLQSVPANAVLIFSMVGYSAQEIPAGRQTSINIVLETDSRKLDEVVVTALGINREKRSLGYATQQVGGKDLNEAPASNFINNLSGKVAGANIISGGSLGSSSRITLRGDKSLDLGKNQPLVIIDGTPVANDGVSNTSGAADYGNSMAAINPADVESVNILKGPAAAALYGSRAANGAIVITTRRGATAKGSGVSVNSYYYNTKVGRLPGFQNEFGGGNSGNYAGSNFGASWSIYPDGTYDGYDESWGPRFDPNRLEAQFDSPTDNGFRGADVSLNNRGNIIATPWIAHPDNIRGFFKTGTKAYNNIALAGNNEKGQYRLSLTSLNETGVIPNNDLDRYQVSLNSSYKLTDKLTSKVRINYAKTESDNRPDNGYGRNTIMYFFTWMNRNVNMNSLKDYWQTGLNGIRQFQYNYGENHNNPYFLQYENTKGQDKNHVYGNIELNYAFTPKLNLMVRTALDHYNDFRPMKWAVSDVDNPFGRYEEYKIAFTERNSDFLLSYNNEIANGDLTYKLSAGGNRYDLEGNSSNTAAPNLLVPGIYNFGNTRSPIEASSNRSQKRINSLYAMANFGYKDLFYLDITGRNDWSSTLPKNNNSYFYPSASLNTDLRNLFNMPDAFNQARLRLGWAQVGNDTDPYRLYNVYDYRTIWGTEATLAGPGTLYNAHLKPEITSTYEIGTAWSFLNNRLSVDLTYYDIRTRNQIINLPMVTSSGYSARVINAGKVKNTGFEVMLSATPVQSPSSFRWDISLNWARNIGKVLELDPETDVIRQAAPGEEASIQARVGERMGAIWGPGYQRVTEGPMKGEIIIFSNGRARGTTEDVMLGNVNPDWTAGMTNQFFYKNFFVNTVISGQVGGQFVSRFYNKAVGSGMMAESVEGRSARTKGNEYSSPYYIPGAAQMSDGSYQANNTSTDGTFSQGVYGTDIRGFFKGRMDHITESQLFSGTYFKLRELSVGYSLPASMLSRTFVTAARLSFTGRNLVLWTPSGNRHFDPEVSVATASNGLIPGFENMSLPSTKEYGISLNLQF
ncbi:MAG: SusC/RagA family TonB-linked outer membrane protein [Candidatus Pseudobacter hemicellulosilyticus]|uniref:SusC/RagA family TonB-linked outer membrane protein n=1 Tax=Candidatus Pseudobacter hemicellulosilyticus TaxID=3121375 RepID=A0AAJ5WPB8_9BACT|nr:MAG: SusC/RagA family TonB-linked outer membrane protein [Pseudobacter sp.]